MSKLLTIIQNLAQLVAVVVVARSGDEWALNVLRFLAAMSAFHSLIFVCLGGKKTREYVDENPNDPAPVIVSRVADIITIALLVGMGRWWLVTGFMLGAISVEHLHALRKKAKAAKAQ